MSLQRLPAEQALARMVTGAGFSAIIDARSEGEFALDHLPGAVNWPSLNDEQRIVIGTLFSRKRILLLNESCQFGICIKIVNYKFVTFNQSFKV